MECLGSGLQMLDASKSQWGAVEENLGTSALCQSIRQRDFTAPSNSISSRETSLEFWKIKLSSFEAFGMTFTLKSLFLQRFSRIALLKIWEVLCLNIGSCMDEDS